MMSKITRSSIAASGWFYRLVICMLLVTAACAQAQPGTLVEITPTGTLSPAEIDARTAGRFRNNGERAPAAQYPVDTYLLQVESTWFDGSPTPITAQLFIPRVAASERILFTFAPGSTGLVEACAPSRPFVETGQYGTYNAYTLAYAGQGLVSVMPNYPGFFEIGVIQPYFVRLAEGQAVLDVMRAVPEALTRLGSDLIIDAAFVGGFSQGGHAAFAAADLLAEYAPEVPLRGVIGFGPTTRLEALFREFTYVAPWVVYSYATFFGERMDPAQVLAEPYLSRLVGDAENQCIAGVQGYYPSSPEALYQPEFLTSLLQGTLEETHPGIAELFVENDAGLAGHGLPALILQGVDDPVVTLDSQNIFVEQLCALGSAVRYPNYLRTRHETRYLGFHPAIEWMEALQAGKAPPSDCGLINSTN